MTIRWRNWSGLESALPTRQVAPQSAEEIAAIIQAGEPVKMAGTGHSFTGIAVPVGVQLLPTGLTGIVDVDRDAMTATAYAGTRLKLLNASL